jgi:hypothetical protein
MKNKLTFYRNLFWSIYGLVLSVLIWVGITCTIQRFKCPQMTETQLYLNIPHSFVCDWKYCE